MSFICLIICLGSHNQLPLLRYPARLKTIHSLPSSLLLLLLLHIQTISDIISPAVALALCLLPAGSFSEHFLRPSDLKFETYSNFEISDR
jgi:hypothetical protein